VADAPAAKNSIGAKKFSTSRLISPRRLTMEMPACQRGQMPPAAISSDRGSTFSAAAAARARRTWDEAQAGGKSACAGGQVREAGV